MGLKKTSSTITISTKVSQAVPNAFETNALDLQLNALDQEVFVVEAIKIDFMSPLPFTGIFVAGVHTARDEIAITTTRPLSMPSLANSNCLAYSNRLTMAGVTDPVAPAVTNRLSAFSVLEQGPADTPDTNLDYIGIIATSDVFLSVDSANSTSNTDATVRMYGYRAKADAATYAALVQSEVLSN